MNENINCRRNQIIRVVALLIAGSMLVMITPTAAQAQWTFEPIAKVGVEKDDNATLSIRTDDVRDVTGILYDLNVRFDYRSPITSFFITPQIISRNYSDDPDLDSDDIFVKSVYRRDMQSSMIRVRLDYDDQSARTAERADRNCRKR